MHSRLQNGQATNIFKDATKQEDVGRSIEGQRLLQRKPAVKLESVISSPRLKRRREKRGRKEARTNQLIDRRSEGVLVAGQHVEVSPGLAGVSVARLARQRHHSDDDDGR